LEVAVDRTLTSGRAREPARRIDVRLLAGLFVLVVTVFAGLGFWQAMADETPILVVAREVPAGSALSAADLQTVSMRLPSELSGYALNAVDQNRVVGRVASEPLHPGELIGWAQLGGRPAIPPGGGVVAFPVNAASAANGRIQVGDHVRIVATWNKGRDDARTQTVLPDAVVYDVVLAPPSGLGSGRADATTLSSLSIVVNDATTMEQLAAAKESAALDVVWLPPAGRVVVPAAPTPLPPATPTGAPTSGR
jgi:Flp pilus assembly protein CpaB